VLKAILAQGELARAERDGQTYGVRNLLHIAPVREVIAMPKIVSCLMPLLGPGFRAVRGLFFDKTAKANWPVLWHQDLTLALRERRDLQGWTNWTVKRGVTHAQPPPEILNRMVTMRLHLDDCPVENGALRIVSGSHGEGLLSRDTIQDAAKAAESIAAKAGEALFMRPLLLHASSPAQTPSHRRVLHLEFAPANLLPPELAWAEA
jgi:ectoine hydroxylase-related dioxygenase (phytanoyl-CoA dioxygenase family)